MVEPAIAQRILCAEDDDMSFFILKTMLKKQPVELTRAVDGVDVFQKYQERPKYYELILMDIEMPNMNGLEAAQKIRQYEVKEDLPPTMIVALTAHDEPEYHRKIFDARMNSIVQKPVNPQLLLQAMRVALENKPTPMAPAASSPLVNVDDDIRAALDDVKKLFWNNLADYCMKIRAFCETGDFESIRIIGHTIKGFGGHLLHPRVTELGRAIQIAGVERNMSSVKELTSELMDYVSRVDHESTLSARLQQLRMETSSPMFPAMGTPQLDVAPSSPSMELDAAITAMKARFMQDLNDDIVKISLALEIQDYELVARIGHILKGVGGNLGHAAVTDIGRSIQVAALDRDDEKVRRLVAELQSYVSSVTGLDEADHLAVSPALQMKMARGGGGASPRIDGGASGTQSTDISVPLGSLMVNPDAMRVPEYVHAAAVAAAPTTLQVPLTQLQLTPSVVTFKRAVVATYVKELPTYVDALQVALDSANWAAVLKVSSSLHKSAATLQNDTLEQFAKDLDDSAARQSLPDATRTTSRLAVYLEQAPM